MQVPCLHRFRIASAEQSRQAGIPPGHLSNLITRTISLLVLRNLIDMSRVWYVYALESKIDQRIYVGMTKDLNRRIKEHNLGRTSSTRAYRPWVLIYHEVQMSTSQARSREKYLKTGIGKEFLKSLVR
jgi:putative endonuclease